MSRAQRRRPGRPTSANCRYRQIAEDLRRRIAKGELPIGSVLPPLRRLAETYGTGQHTVRMGVEALRREGRVRSGPGRRLVIAPVGAHRGPLDGAVVVVSSVPLDAMHRSPYMGELLRGIEIGAGEQCAPLLVVPGGEFFRRPPEEVLRLPLRGLLLVGVYTDAVLERYEKLTVPTVLVDQPTPGRKLHTVTVENVSAAREATERLIALGHRRIAFVRSLQLNAKRVDPDALERQEGFFGAIKAAGLPARQCEAMNILKTNDEKSTAVKSVVCSKRRFTAAVAASGSLAEVVARAARAVGKKIPEDLSISCLQGREAGFTRFSGPRMNFEEVGRRGVGLLSEPKSPAQHLRVPTEWGEAGSMAAPPGS